MRRHLQAYLLACLLVFPMNLQLVTLQLISRFPTFLINGFYQQMGIELEQQIQNV